MGALTPQAIQHVSDQGGNIGAFITALNIHQTTSATRMTLVSFGCIAVLASLMSASIGLSDYLEDILNKISRRGSRPLAIFLTYFLPPWPVFSPRKDFYLLWPLPAFHWCYGVYYCRLIYSLMPGVPPYRRYIFSRPAMSF
jgi:hypothetical protein